MISTTVHDTYDLLAELVGRSRPAGDLDLTDRDADHEAMSLLVTEARLLDERAYEQWLQRWHADGTLWVPLGRAGHPARDQSFFLDDLRRLRERVAWLGEPSAWSRRPHSAVIRQVANVETWTVDDGGLGTEAVVVLHEHTPTGARIWATRQFHLFDAAGADGARRIRAKVILAPALLSAVPHPGVLL